MDDSDASRSDSAYTDSMTGDDAVDDHNNLFLYDEDEDDMDPDFVDEPNEEDDDEDGVEYYDADDGQLQLLLDAENDLEADYDYGGLNPFVRFLNLITGADGDADAAESAADNERAGAAARAQLVRLIQGGHIVIQAAGEEDDDDEDVSDWEARDVRSPSKLPNFPKVPSDEGRKLMHSGLFGANEYRVAKQKQLARRILDRELGLGGRQDRLQNQQLMAQGLLPSSKPEMIVHYDDRVYSGQFSDDGNFFYSCGHDFKVRMYDTSNPYNWKYYKTVSYPWGQWTLTDASLSPDNRWLAYTSIQSSVCLAPTDPNDTGDPYSLDLAERAAGQRRANWRSRHSFGIWSVRFSGDGRELVAGTNVQSIVVYDIESRTVLHNVVGHEEDVNAVCFADKSSPHILYSGSDDATIKVWDRRSMGDQRPAGAFVGHVEGLTYIDSKGDGRYILSNGKDQTMKLWDLRMVMSMSKYEELNPTRVTRNSDFDYRWGTYRDENWFPHPNDNSLVTFRGHRVMRTLIRCHFSPPSSTNSRYVYSGSQDGKVYVWNLDATLAGTIDVRRATKDSRPVERRYRIYHGDDLPGWNTCVRDVSWHPNVPVLVASAWNGFDMAHGTCTLHSFNEAEEDEAEPAMGRSVDERLRDMVPRHEADYE